MIVFLVTGEHAYTLQSLRAGIPDLDIEALPYEQALSLDQLPAATYVFTDVDRLPVQSVLQAGRLYRKLASPDSGCRVLNDPARVRSRYGLLRSLYRQRLNAFNAYRADEAVMPERFPVFVRYEQEHDAPLSDLLPDQAALNVAIARCVGMGVPEHAILVVEYCAQPIAEGVYRRLAAYRVGDQIFAAEAVHEDSWCVKHGKLGLATARHYREELEMVRSFPYAGHLMRVFEVAGVEYGRADYGIVDGRPQVYEINTNPRIGRPGDHPSAERSESQERIRSNLLDALRALDPGD